MSVYRKLVLSLERGRYLDHLLRLSAVDRHARFMGTVGEQSIRRHVATAEPPRAIVVAAVMAGHIRGATELRLDGRGGAELAVSVEQDWQGQGLGTALVDRTLTIARNRGVREVTMVCLPDNRRMMRIARNLMGPCRWEDGEVASTVSLPAATPLTLVQEAVADGAVPVASLLDQWQRPRAEPRLAA